MQKKRLIPIIAALLAIVTAFSVRATGSPCAGAAAAALANGPAS